MSSSDTPSDPGEDWHQPEKTDLHAVVVQLSKELEWMGLTGIGDGSVESDDDTLGLVINSAYELIGVIRQLRHSKRQRDDHAQQLSHELQRCQWLLERQKERCERREREASDAREKQRQADVRLRGVQAALKKKTDQHRQLLRESQLKDNQWQHAMRRKDMEIERLQQQLVKLMSAKQNGLGPIEVDVRGSLTTQVSPTSTGGRRKRWDRVDESRNQRAIEDKWKLVVSGLEKEIEALRSDYQLLIGTAGAFLDRVRHEQIPPNVKEWIQLPLSLIGPQLEAIFKTLGESWPSSEVTDSHDSVREFLRHDAEIEQWSLYEPDWVSSLSKDEFPNGISDSEPVKESADLKLDNLKAAIKAAIKSVPNDSSLSVTSNCTRSSTPGVTSQAIDPGAGRASLISSSTSECVSVTGRHHREAASRTPNQPSRSKFYFQTL